MTVTEMIDQADITAVWTALGGAPLRHGRGKGFWRDGDGYNVKLDRDQCVWFDHRDGIGGGVIGLIRHVLDCQPKDAVVWLAGHEGVELDDEKLTVEERRAWAERQRWARAEGEKLAEWRDEHVAALKARRNDLWCSGREAMRLGHELLIGGAHDSLLWDVVWKHCTDDLHGDEINAEIERVLAMSWREIWHLRQSLSKEKVTA